MGRWNSTPVFLDFETQSSVDLKLVGGRRYAEHPHTRVLSAVALVDDVFHVWVPSYISDRKVNTSDLWISTWGPRPEIIVHTDDTLPEAFKLDRTYAAHNAFGFDRHIMANVCKFNCDWVDTLYLCRIAGLPGGLDAVAEFLRFGRKDDGHRILMKMVDAKVDAGRVVYADAPIGSLTAVLRYNVQDVRLLQMLWEHLDTLPVEEDTIDAHNTINDRGVEVDLELVKMIQYTSILSIERAVEDIQRLTNGELTLLDAAQKKVRTAERAKLKRKGLAPDTNQQKCIRSQQDMLIWLKSKGVRIEDSNGKATLRKDVVDQALANPWMMVDAENPFIAAKAIPEEVFEVLRLRSAALRITGAKLNKVQHRVSDDHRIRDLFTYHTAHTGRASSTGVQVHNLPRPKKTVDVSGCLQAYWNGEWTTDNAYDFCKRFGPNVDDVLSALIRPVLIPKEDHLFLISDFAAIECCGLAWIAEEFDLLDRLARRDKVYEAMASVVFGKPIDQVSKDERQVGKTIILGAGYGMSSEKFGIFCGLSGVDLQKAGVTPEQCIEAYRSTYPKIAGTPSGVFNGRAYRRGGIWSQVGEAAKAALSGGLHKAGKCSFLLDESDLVCELPSGRQLRYHNCRIEDRVPGWAFSLGIDSPPKATIVYDSARGERSTYGAKLVENIVQAICRDLLMDAVVRCENSNLPVVLHVHDEIVCEVPYTQANQLLPELASIMKEPPVWANGFPINVEAFVAPAYVKGPISTDWMMCH